MSLPDVEGSITLTSHSHLARWILFKHGQKQKAKAHRSWATPSVLTLNAWMRQRWVSSWPAKFILSPLQSRHLWESIIKEKFEGLLHLEEAAEFAVQAYSLLQQYQLPLKSNLFDWTPESRAFYKWTKIYQKHLQEWNALAPSTLIDAVLQAMRLGKIPLPNKRVILAGFNIISPQIGDWITYLQTHGVEVQHWTQQSSGDIDFDPALTEVRSFSDPDEEIEQCARWARTQQLPGKIVGIAVPNLQKKRSKILRELSAELVPDSIFPWINRDLPFTLSSLPPLDQHPAIQLALTMLSSPNSQITIETFSLILGTPFLDGGLEESIIRNQLDWKLRQIFGIDLEEADNLSEDTIKLKNIIQTWRNFIETKDQYSALFWAKRFDQFLRHIGWPNGDGPMTGYLNKVYEAWIQCLDAFSSLDRILGPMNRVAATSALTRIINETTIEINPQENLIQVMDLKKTDGMHFDSLWVLGCTDDIFPSIPAPNPFIPIHLQKKYNIPHCDSNWELGATKRKFSELLFSARERIFSYPTWEKEMKTTMSPLLKSYPIKNIPNEPSHRLIDRLNSNLKLEAWNDPPAIFSNQNEALSKPYLAQTSTRIIQDQASCPFKAFAVHRLNVETKPSLETDYGSKERGILIHRVLEKVWGTIKNRSNLETLNRENKLEKIIKKALQDAAKLIFKTFLFKLQPRFISMEMEIIENIVKKWLKFELNRPDFEVILREYKDTVSLGGLEFHIRIDRLDRLTDGREILIDYKTGAIEPRNWFHERIQEPQLPLYALKYRPRAIALASIQKNDKDLELKAVVDPSTVFTAMKEVDFKKPTGCSDWNELMDYWKFHLTDQVQSFLLGRAKVDPFNQTQTCRHCGLETLCRINELSEIREEESP